METGMLSSEEFEHGALRFADLWQQRGLAGSWVWQPASNGLDGGYLAMEGVPRKASHSQQLGSLEDLQGGSVESATDEEADCAVVATAAPNKLHLFDYHIAYHPSYSVPTLLFRGRCRSDGSFLEWEELTHDLPAASRQLASKESSRWAFITQQEHPVLRRPWYSPHPCETAALMRRLLTTAEAEAACAAADISSPEAGDDPSQELASNAAAVPHAAAQSLPELPLPRSFTRSAGSGKFGIAEEGHLGKVVTRSAQMVGCQVDDSGVSISSHSSNGGLRYLRAWISLVAPAVGLPMPVDFWKL